MKRYHSFQTLKIAAGSALLAAAAGAGCSSSAPPAAAPSASAAPQGPANREVAPASTSRVRQGIEAIQAGDHERARQVLSEAATESPADPQAAYYLGVALDALGETEQAIGEYRRALELDPRLTEAHVNLSGALLDSGEPQEALTAAEAGLAVAPNNAELLRNRAMAVAASGDAAASEEAYRAALEAAPDDKEVRYLYAEALARAGRTEAAVSELEKLNDSKSLEVLASAARLLGRLKAFDSCIATLDRALALKDAAELKVQRGLCRHGKKDEAGAQADYEAAIVLDPGFAPAHFYLGQHLRSAGKKAQAADALRKAVELDGDGGVGRAAKKALDDLAR